MERKQLHGTGVALITPFTPTGAVDFRALAHIVDRVIDGGCDYILVLGTTSEAPTMEAEERSAVLSFVRDRAAGRVDLMAGIGGNCTATVARSVESFRMEGYSSILSVCPYYNKPTQEGLYRHFRTIAEHSPLPIVLYNVPSRTGVNMLPETVARLAADCPSIRGIKEASGSVAQIGEVCRLTPESFSVICGDDALTVDAIECGATGVLSVLAHLYPEATSTLVRKALDGHTADARSELDGLRPIVSALFEEGNPTGIKAAMALKGLCSPAVRLPLVQASKALTGRMEKMMSTYENS